MSKTMESIIQALISTIIALILPVVMIMFTQEDGMIFINDPIEIDEGTYISTIELVNYSSKSFSNLEILVPGKIIEIIKPDGFLGEASNGVGDSNFGKFKISTFPAKKQGQLVIKYSANHSSRILFNDLGNNKIKESTYDSSLNPYKSFFKDILVYAVVFSVYFLVLQFLRMKYEKEHRNRTEKLEISNNELKLELAEIRKEVDRIKQVATKYRLLYSARISDYKKELEFWQDTIRKIMYSNCESENLFNMVTDNLKTYRTKRKDDDIKFDYLEIVSTLSKKDENQSK